MRTLWKHELSEELDYGNCKETRCENGRKRGRDRHADRRSQEGQKAFKDFEKLKEGNSKRARADIVRQTCSDLTIHTKLEEEIFYPAARKAIKDTD